MSSAVIAAIIEDRLETTIVNYFRGKRAFNESSAIVPDKIGLRVNLSRYKFLIRVLGTEKYYLDEQLYTKHSQIKSAFLLVLGIALLVVFVLILSRLNKLLG